MEGPVDALDHASPLPHLGSKIGFDATTKWAEEGIIRPWPKKILMDQKVKERIDSIWQQLGIPK
ncbi:MAG: hypothetical protein C0407_06520 [Desulfobacca sp.]|nr:hypothetical protein [Desulfobacca sp.]